jgi:glutaconate CoA-transferase subunit B
VITDCAILRPQGETRALHLASLHPGVSLAEVRDKTGWDLQVSPDLAETSPPSADELAALRAVDPDGFWH